MSFVFMCFEVELATTKAKAVTDKTYRHVVERNTKMRRRKVLLVSGNYRGGMRTLKIYMPTRFLRMSR